MYLTPFTEPEFEHYLSYAVKEYGEEIAKSGHRSAEAAQTQARQQYQELFPQRLESPDQYIFSIEDDSIGQKVGLIWFGVMRQGEKKRAFVYDVRIQPEFRRRGYGEQAFILLEEKVRALGLHEIGLHVFGHNQGARALYQKLGYAETNIQMSKQIS
ncbi:putative N-acetyltransferase YdgE [Tengunoibacter tsumagoiensis]|uniref:Putative N-acetyltransferase YdgE n=1 Tax=Tengunoibacter tsumagoiensis TaxID=2014871 RepID=A0A402A4S9_9CHLR|nr:putative N-acetyltransferase YdgE [Tengunoibacter tsumagoiensis]